LSSSGTQQRRRSLCRGERFDDDDDDESIIVGGHVGHVGQLSPTGSDNESRVNVQEVERTRYNDFEGVLTVCPVIRDRPTRSLFPSASAINKHDRYYRWQVSDRCIAQPLHHSPDHEHQRQCHHKLCSNGRSSMTAWDREDGSLEVSYLQHERTTRPQIRHRFRTFSAVRGFAPSVVERQPRRISKPTRRCLPIPPEQPITFVAKRNSLHGSRRRLGTRRTSKVRLLYDLNDDTDYDAADGISI